MKLEPKNTWVSMSLIGAIVPIVVSTVMWFASLQSTAKAAGDQAMVNAGAIVQMQKQFNADRIEQLNLIHNQNERIIERLSRVEKELELRRGR